MIGIRFHCIRPQIDGEPPSGNIRVTVSDDTRVDVDGNIRIVCDDY